MRTPDPWVESDAAESDTLLRRFVLANARHTTSSPNESVDARRTARVLRGRPRSACSSTTWWCCSRRPQYVDFDRVMEELLASTARAALLSAVRLPTGDLAEHGRN